MSEKMTLDEAKVEFQGMKKTLNFMDEERIWFEELTDGCLLVCFYQMALQSDGTADLAFVKLREICVRHGSKFKASIVHEANRNISDKFIYAFSIPSMSSEDCYEELKRNSA